jgi:hypothetical protein
MVASSSEPPNLLSLLDFLALQSLEYAILHSTLLSAVGDSRPSSKDRICREGRARVIPDGGVMDVASWLLCERLTSLMMAATSRGFSGSTSSQI